MSKKPYTSLLFAFAYFPNYDKVVEYLTENLADTEAWDFSDSTKKGYSILKNYLEHTFRKLQSEGKISYTYSNSHACFNTGLVTKNLEPIYALFETYRNLQQSVNPSQFCFKAFLKESDTQFLKVFPDNHPDIADFFSKTRRFDF